MMKTTILQLTLICVVLPLLNIHFNIFTTFEAPIIPSADKYNICLLHSNSSTHQCEILAHQDPSEQQIAFGADLGAHFNALHAFPVGYKIRRVVLDPGHGGKDTGCSDKNAREKVIALSIAKKLGAAIRTNFPEIDVIYTRSSDIFVPLHERAAIANRSKADLFISIHCNAMDNSTKGYQYVEGSETYVMGLSNTKENLNVAKRENQAILMEDNYRTNYGGFDPNSPEGHIILSMYQNAYLEQSILLAEKIENNIQHFSKQKSRGVKQAGFVVLRQTAMPSVLIESGYLTNAKDRTYLNSETGQQTTAAAILRAFRAYKNEVESSPEISVAVTPITPAPIPTSIKNYDNSSDASNRYRQLMVKENMNGDQTQNTKAVPKSYNQVERLQPATIDNSITAADNNIQFKVQILNTDKLVNTKEGPWNKIKHSVELRSEPDGIKYLVIGFNKLDEAINAKKEMRALGFKEAFVVAFKGNKRISVAEAKNELNR